MKKFIALLLAVVMTASLCACGAPKPEKVHIIYDGNEVKSLEFTIGFDEIEDIVLEAEIEPDGAEGEIEWESADKDIVKVKDNGDGTCKLVLKDIGDTKITASCGDIKAKVKVTVNEMAEADEAPAEEEPAAEEPAVENPPLGSDPPENGSIAGITIGSSFTHSGAHIALNLPAGWRFLDEAEIAQVTGTAFGMMDEGALKDALIGGASPTIMLAQDNVGNSVNMNVTQLDVTDVFLTESGIAEMSASVMEEAMKQAGYSVSNIKTFSDYTFAGKSHSGLSMTVTTQGINVYEKIIVIVEGAYYYCITASCALNDNTDEVLGMFLPY